MTHKQSHIAGCIIAFILAVTGHSSYTQQLFFRHLTKENGLISNRVTAICQDKKGYIWIGTQTGLQRYDGTRFITYLSDLYDSTALQNDWISTIFEDSKGRLWIGTDRGAPYLFYKETGKFKNVNLTINNHNKNLKGVWYFTEDSKGDIWVASRMGFFKYDTVSSRFENKNKLLGLSDDIAYEYVSMDHSGNLWFATGNGIKELNIHNQQVYSSSNNPEHLAVFNIKEQLANIKFDKSGSMWVSTGYDFILYKFDFATNYLQSFKFEKKEDQVIDTINRFDMIGPVFITSGDQVLIPLFSRGLAMYDRTKNKFTIEDADNGIPYKLHIDPEGYMYLIEDREQNIWIGSNAGISIFNSANQHFVTYGFDKNASIDYLTSKPVAGFLQNKNQDIFVSYYCLNGGIAQLDSNLHLKNHFLYEENGRSNPVSNMLWGLFEDKNGIIWAPNQNGRILQLDTKTGKLSQLREGSLVGYITDIMQDADSTVWMAHWSKGLVKITHQSKMISSFTAFSNPQMDNLKRAICLLDDDDKIWVGTFENGLQVFDKVTSAFITSYVMSEQKSGSISNNTVMSLLKYNNDTLIVATEGGINIFDKTRATFKTITSKNGLPNNLAIAIITDDDHNLWAAFEGGVCKINMRTYAVTNYGLNDGIIENSFNGKFTRLKDGRIMIGSAKSFIIFDPKKVGGSSAPPDVTITSFRVFDKQINTDSLVNSSDKLFLSYLDNSLQIEFASLYFNARNKIKYYYQLEGIDKVWIAADNENDVNYSQLNPGSYTFKIKCSSNDGIFCKNVTTLFITIVPPYWKTWWFFCLVIIACLSVGVFIIKWRERNIRALVVTKIKAWESENALGQKKAELATINQQLAEVQLTALRSQMNPHFIFNALNSIKTFVIENDADNAEKYLDKFAKLIRFILDTSQSNMVLLNKEIELLTLYLDLEQLRFSDKLNYSISVDENINPSSVMIPSMLIQPFVENAVLHGILHKENNGHISINFIPHNTWLQIVIQDNGVGREKSSSYKNKSKPAHRSLSIEITNKRLQGLKKDTGTPAGISITDLKNEQLESTGTRVSINVPL